MPRDPVPLLKQIEKIMNDRVYLRTVIESMLAVARDIPGSLNPEVASVLRKALDRTADA